MNTAEFVQTYQNATLSERSVAIQHFLHLCDLLGHPHPVSNDPTGEGFTFTIAFNPKKDEIATAGFDGQVRLFEVKSGNIITNFVPVPLS